MAMLSEVTGAGDPLVLVPGVLTGWLSWIPFAERLASSRKVVRVQLLTVQLGLSAQPLPADYSPESESAALAETLKSLGLMPPVDFAAWSYGAEVTLDFALDNPGWVRTLTLIEPQVFWVFSSGDAEAKRELEVGPRMSRDDVTEDQLEAFVRSVGLVPLGSNPRELPQWPLWLDHRQSLRPNSFIEEYQADPLRLSGFMPPVLLVKGTGSMPLFHRIVDELGRQLPNAQVVELPAGHAPHIVSMEPFLERLAAFQASAGPGP